VHIEFYINDVYNGLFILIEHINDDFLNLLYGNDHGNLYKCLWPANLNYISDDPNDYKFESNGRRTYDLKNNLDEDDYSDIANFIDVLNNTPINDLYCELSKVFDVEDFLEILAIDVLTGNWDGYSFNKNNFYLYHNPETDRFQYIPYDLDNTLGIDWFNIDWTDRNIYNWSSGWEYLPLYERSMDNAEMKEIFTYYVNDIATQLEEESFYNDIDDLRDLIAPFAEEDTFRILDYGFSYEDFWDSFEEEIPYDHVDAGIKPFYEDRTSSALNQVQTQNIAPIVRYIKVEPLVTQVPIAVSAFVEDEEGADFVRAIYTYMGETDSISLFDDGLHGDGEAADGWFANSMGTFDEADELTVFIRTGDEQNNIRSIPCEAYNFTLIPGSPLVINEFMAKNDSSIQDNTGAYSDWVEIYNNSNEAIDLAGYYLSDDLNDNSKWAFPDVTIEAFGFYLIWCSGDTSLGENHTGFKLSASGEDVALWNAQSVDTLLVDGLSFGEQYADTSYGREVDAHPNWVFFDVPTPNASNGVFPVGINEFAYELLNLNYYPNPFDEKVTLVNTGDAPINVEVFGIDGKRLSQFTLIGFERFEYSDRERSGVRLLKCSTQHAVKVVKLIKN
jgi:hypothetical protein